MQSHFSVQSESDQKLKRFSFSNIFYKDWIFSIYDFSRLDIFSFYSEIHFITKINRKQCIRGVSNFSAKSIRKRLMACDGKCVKLKFKPYRHFCRIVYLLQITSFSRHGRSPTPNFEILQKSYKKVYSYRNLRRIFY